MSKDYAKAFYHSKKWKDTQLSYMVSQNYICERCGSLARIVHHKKYITSNNINNPDITLNWSNLEALCMNCHTNEHLKSGICSNEVRFTDSGDLIKSPLH